jgi:hypothetical protein
MSSSVFELIMARVQAVLLSATAAGANVYRARDDAFSSDDVPAINIRRAETAGDVLGTGGERHLVAFSLGCFAEGDDWETAVDSLHMQAHALLLADATLATLGHGLRCTATDAEVDSADQPAGRLNARYQMQVFVRPGDLTTAIN